MKSPKKSSFDPKRTRPRESLAERFAELKLLRKRVDDLEKEERRQTESAARAELRDHER
jgi:hypothetical protein